MRQLLSAQFSDLNPETIGNLICAYQSIGKYDKVLQLYYQLKRLDPRMAYNSVIFGHYLESLAMLKTNYAVELDRIPNFLTDEAYGFLLDIIGQRRNAFELKECLET